MCGIAGFVDFSKKATRKHLVDMTDILSHRGPDGSGYFIDHNTFGTVGMGHRRLSIIDLSEQAGQPMESVDGSQVIVFNGEIYNYREVRSQLEKCGVVFRTNSDTEVILEAYRTWGIISIHRFIGMFAFSLYDKRNSKLFLVRDRQGIKPFYFSQTDKFLLFGSELKSLCQYPTFIKQIDISALDQYLRYGYVPAPFTIYTDAKKLPPGHYLEIDLATRRQNQVCYWSILEHFSKPKLTLHEDELLHETELLLKSACEYRMVADVPVGVFLSGGYDSSLVTSLLQSNRAQPLQTFTIGFEYYRYNEANHARKVAEFLGTDHSEYFCTTKEAIEIIPELPHFFDEPFADTSAIPTILVSKLARQKVKVAISADAGDEVFAGYDLYVHALNYYHQGNRVPKCMKDILIAGIHQLSIKSWPSKLQYTWGRKLEKLSDILTSKNCVEVMKHTSKYFNGNELNSLRLDPRKDEQQIIAKNFPIQEMHDPLNAMLAFDFRTYLPDDILVKVDRATMAVGLEGREPLLDHRIAELYAKVPSNFKINNGVRKYMLKRIAHKYLPEDLLNRPKMGFGSPIAHWLSGDLDHYLKLYLNKERVARQGLFEPEAVDKLVKAFHAIPDSFIAHKIWVLLVFQLWYDEWMN